MCILGGGLIGDIFEWVACCTAQPLSKQEFQFCIYLKKT